MVGKSVVKDVKETNFEFCNDDQPACFSSTESKWIQRILKLLKKYPDDVELVDYKEKESICVHMPKDWFKVGPPRSKTMTEEQRKAASERGKKMAEDRRAKAEAEKIGNEGWL